METNTLVSKIKGEAAHKKLQNEVFKVRNFYDRLMPMTVEEVEGLIAEIERLQTENMELQARIDGVAAMQPLSMSRALSEQYIAFGYNMALGKVQSRLGVESEDTAS